MSETEKARQIKPIDHRVAAIWEHDWSDYADIIKVPMEDGTVVTYRREIEQPHPQCLKTLEIIRMMKGNTYGGTRRRAGRRCNAQPAREKNIP